MQQHQKKAGGPGSRSPAGRGGGRASAALPLLDDVTTSPASRRLASARPRSTAGATVLAPKCELIIARALRPSGNGTSQDDDLMSQGKDFGLERETSSKAGEDG